jgi:ribosomal-protein-alanine N-acetyltransferase
VSERRGGRGGATGGRRGRGTAARIAAGPTGAGPTGAGQGALLLETPRLTLREFTAGDFEDLLRLDSDPRVMRYIARGRPATSDEVAAALKRILNYGRVNYGLGLFRAARRGAGVSTVGRDDGAFIGWGCLKYTPPTCDVEVGYRLLPGAWGHGYATEIATALVRYGFETLTLDRIIGVTHPGNAASQRVLLKSGLADAGWGRYYGRRLRLFAQDRARWLAAHP